MRSWVFALKITKTSPRWSEKCAQVPIFGSKLAMLGPSWRQVGDLGRHLHPSCRQDGLQEAFRKVVKRRSFCNPRRNLPKIPKRLPKCSQKARPMLPNVPKSTPKCSKNPTHFNHYPTLHTVRHFLFISSSPPGLTSFLLSALSGPLLYRLNYMKSLDVVSYGIISSYFIQVLRDTRHRASDFG